MHSKNALMHQQLCFDVNVFINKRLFFQLHDFNILFLLNFNWSALSKLYRPMSGIFELKPTMGGVKCLLESCKVSGIF